MRTLGLIGGLGPESTVDYYTTIIRIYRDQTGDGSYPQFFINSIDLNRARGFVEVNALDELVAMLLAEIEKLARAGATFGIIAANTPHLVFDELAAHTPIPLISIVEATRDAAQSRGLKRLALFGTSFTVTGRFYPEVFSRTDIQLVSPSAEDQDFIHDKYMNELVNGKLLPATHDALVAIVERMRQQQKIDGVILAGTELPLILREAEHNGVPLLNTTEIHCRAAVGEMLKQQTTGEQP